MELKPCPCGATPVRETQRVSLGRVEDGGYDIFIGRYKCPVCGNAPSWGQSYSVMYGWDKNIGVWNRRVGPKLVEIDQFNRVGEGEK